MKTLIEQVIDIATKAHAGQFRRDGKTPYILHVSRVAKTVEDAGCGINAIATAWLHDVLEDADMTADRLYELDIPGHIIDAVLILTHRRDEPYMDYVRRILRSNMTHAREVKMADIIDNLTDNPTEKQKQKYVKALMLFAT